MISTCILISKGTLSYNKLHFVLYQFFNAIYLYLYLYLKFAHILSYKGTPNSKIYNFTNDLNHNKLISHISKIAKCRRFLYIIECVWQRIDNQHFPVIWMSCVCNCLVLSASLYYNYPVCPDNYFSLFLGWIFVGVWVWTFFEINVSISLLKLFSFHEITSTQRNIQLPETIHHVDYCL